MIIKILEEMQSLRLNKSFENYEDFVDVLRKYINEECFKKRAMDKNIDTIYTIVRHIENEIKEIDEILKSVLSDKKYKTFKTLAVIHTELISLHTTLSCILN